MNRFLPFLVLLFFTKSQAQDSLVKLSRFEEFNNQPGQIIRTESKEVGYVLGISISRVRSNNISSGETKEVISLKSRSNNGGEIVNSEIIYLELSEIDSIIQVLDYFLKQAENPKIGSQLFYNYVTLDDVAISFYHYDNAPAIWRISIGRLYKNTHTKFGPSTYNFNAKRLEEFIELLVAAKSLKL